MVHNTKKMLQCPQTLSLKLRVGSGNETRGEVYTSSYLTPLLQLYCEARQLELADMRRCRSSPGTSPFLSQCKGAGTQTSVVPRDYEIKIVKSILTISTSHEINSHNNISYQLVTLCAYTRGKARVCRLLSIIIVVT